MTRFRGPATRWVNPVGMLLLTVSVAAGQGALEQLEQELDSAAASEQPSTSVGELPPPVPDLEQQDGPPAADNRASLGINVVEITDRLQTRYGLAVRRGALISFVRPGTAAAKYGLPIGGAIVAVDGRKIESADDLVATIETYQPGDVVEISYFDGDRMGRKRIRLGQRVPATLPFEPAPTAPRTATPPVGPQDGPLPLARPDDSRPLLNTLEGLLDRLGAPDPPAEAVDPGVLPPNPAGMADELTELRQQIQALQQQLDWLQQRVDQLERHLPAVEPSLDQPEPAASSD